MLDGKGSGDTLFESKTGLNGKSGENSLKSGKVEEKGRFEFCLT